MSDTVKVTSLSFHMPDGSPLPSDKIGIARNVRIEGDNLVGRIIWTKKRPSQETTVKPKRKPIRRTKKEKGEVI